MSYAGIISRRVGREWSSVCDRRKRSGVVLPVIGISAVHSFGMDNC
jgi:hypothetical protein